MLLAIELFDELVFGAREAAWPSIRADLGLSYGQVGLLLSLPVLASLVLEPAIGLLGDTGYRGRLVVGGGVCLSFALGLAALAPGFGLLLAAFLLLSPASGAFVSLSQATLIDLAPDRREQSMVGWTLAGSIGVAVGPLLFVAGLGWRVVLASFAGLGVALALAARRIPHRTPSTETGVRVAFAAVRRPGVLRWLLLLELQNLAVDILYGYLALYFVDVVGVGQRGAALAIAVWTGAGLAGNVLVAVALRRIPGLTWLRATALGGAVVFPAFQLVHALGLKLALTGALGVLVAGWYPISQTRLYAALPGQSGVAMALATTSGLLGAAFPLALGLLAQRVGLQDAFWLVALAPVGLLVLAPRRD